MRGTTKQIFYETVKDLTFGITQLSSAHYHSQAFKNVIHSAFGNGKEVGIISNLIQKNYNVPPVVWSKQFDNVTSLLGPNSILLNQTIEDSDSSMIIDARILPRCVLDQTNSKASFSSRAMKSLRKQGADLYLIATWEWYWCHLMHSFISLPQIQQTKSFEEDQKEDELFRMLTKNIYLVLIRQGLQQYTKNQTGSKELFKRMRSIIELYLIEDLHYKMTIKKDLKYRLKSHYLGAFFLLAEHKHRNSRADDRAGSLDDYGEFINVLLDNYSTISTQGENNIMSMLLRIWLYLITIHNSPDNSLIKVLDKANSNDGWYKLARISIQKWFEMVTYPQPPIKQIQKFNASKKKVYNLLAKLNQWTPSMGFYNSLQRFLRFESWTCERQISVKQKKGSRSEQQSIVVRCFQRILGYISEKSSKSELISHYEKRMTDEISHVYGKADVFLRIQRSREERQSRLSRSSREQLKSLNYFSPRARSAWEYPLQQNQFYLLYQGSLYVARTVDRWLPGSKDREYPWLNLRFLSNPFIFTLAIVVIFFFTKILMA